MQSLPLLLPLIRRAHARVLSIRRESGRPSTPTPTPTPDARAQVSFVASFAGYEHTPGIHPFSSVADVQNRAPETLIELFGYLSDLIWLQLYACLLISFYFAKKLLAVQVYTSVLHCIPHWLRVARVVDALSIMFLVYAYFQLNNLSVFKIFWDLLSIYIVCRWPKTVICCKLQGSLLSGFQ